MTEKNDQAEIWEQVAHAILGAAIELGFDIDKITEKSKLIMMGNEVYRFVGHENKGVTQTIINIDSLAEEIKSIYRNKPKKN